MWKIHNKYYDLSNFLDKHPGGSKILESCSDVGDVTAAFESYHSMCNMNKIIKTMEKYEIEEPNVIIPNHKYTFNQNQFYQEVKEKVRNHFIDKTTKWTWIWFLYAITSLFIYIISFSCTFYYTNLPFNLRIFTSIVAGTSLMQLTFQFYHDATHCAVSSNKYVNEYLSILGSALTFWDYTTWIKHHSIMHHSFTGESKLDPDMRHTQPFFNKSLKSSKNPIVKSSRSIAFILSIFPGMFLGQILSYILCQFRKKLWGFKIYKNKSWIEIGIISLQLILMINGGSFLLPLIFLLTLNINYSIAILPDHDLLETRLNYNENITDWGEIQVRHSGNFANDNLIYTRLYGSINYQIEHHLFPSICSYHLPEIAYIVKDTCKKYDIKYVEIKSIYNAYLSVIENLSIINKFKY